MKKFLLKLYDRLESHRGLTIALLIVITALLVILIGRISYKEDITDFLPLSGRKQQAMRIFQNQSGANRIYIVFGMKGKAESDPDRIVEAVDEYVNGLGKGVVNSVDMEKVSRTSEFVYNNIPYFLTEKDYSRMDSLLNAPEYVDQQLQSDMEELMFPSGGMLSENISRDPLNLFTPTVEKLSATSQQLNYELYDGHIFTPDMKYAVVMFDSPYGSSETEQNGKLISNLESKAQKVMVQYNDIDISITGGPVIAVGNAKQIKTDSILTVAIAVTLILLLLILAFRSLRNISLIALTIAWGWAFALGCLSIVHSNISLIVVGISSIIIGIAVNYPLHLVAHLNHTPNIRKALGEIVEPLLVGNITTIGAFLALVPLKSVALRDLGLFSMFLLLGTIFFVLVFLPHFVKSGSKTRPEIFGRVGNLKPENSKWLVIATAVITLVLAFFSVQTSFDSNISHINYMTDAQKATMKRLSEMLKSDNKTRTVYAVASGNTAEEALQNNETLQKEITPLNSDYSVKGIQTTDRFLVSKKEQEHRLALWHDFVARYGKKITEELNAKGNAAGFSSDSFKDFFQILSVHYNVKDFTAFKPLTDGVLSSRIYHDDNSGSYSILTPITVESAKVDALTEQLNNRLKTGYAFEISQLNRSVADSLSDNFNYISLACSFIVFFFLWLSFGNFELAALSFLPMAVSWIWILGLMSLFGIQFNIINIILAAFIFGQGDDYTIFMTEGCQYEYAYGRKMLASYKNSITISALIMFIGMGVLTFARHPALRSLGEVTIVGMFSVVLMAYLLPPFFFKWLTTKHGEARKRPLTLRSLLLPNRYPQEYRKGSDEADCKRYVKDAYYYCGKDITKTVKASLADYPSNILADEGDTIKVNGGNYGSVALLMALMNPQKTVLALTDNADDADVCANVACRIARNIKMEEKQ